MTTIPIKFTLIVKPILYYPDVRMSDLENSNKVIVPSNVLTRLNEGLEEEIQFPIILQLSLEEKPNIYVCVDSFGPDANSIYIPNRVLQDNWIPYGTKIEVEYYSPPKGVFIKLRPHKTKFIQTSNPKEILENNLVKRYPVISKDETIKVLHNDEIYDIDIIECKPENTILLTDVDVEVEFEQPLDYVEPPKPKPMEFEHPNKKTNFATIFSLNSDLDPNYIEKNNSSSDGSFTQQYFNNCDCNDNNDSEDDEFQPFSVSGYKM